MLVRHALANAIKVAFFEAFGLVPIRVSDSRALGLVALPIQTGPVNARVVPRTAAAFRGITATGCLLGIHIENCVFRTAFRLMEYSASPVECPASKRESVREEGHSERPVRQRATGFGPSSGRHGRPRPTVHNVDPLQAFNRRLNIDDAATEIAPLPIGCGLNFSKRFVDSTLNDPAPNETRMRALDLQPFQNCPEIIANTAISSSRPISIAPDKSHLAESLRLE